MIDIILKIITVVAQEVLKLLKIYFELIIFLNRHFNQFKIYKNLKILL